MVSPLRCGAPPAGRAASVTCTQRQGIRLCACPMRRLLTATFLLLLLLPAAHALAADNPSALLVDACRDEKVDGTYSQRTYKRALQQLPADSDQYTACRDVINRARLAALNNRSRSSGGGNTGASGGSGGGSTSGSGGGSTGSGGGGGSSSGSGSSSAPAPPTPAEQQGVQKAIASGSSPVQVGGKLVQPGAVGSLAGDSRHVPDSLLFLLIALALCALLGGGALGWNRVVARRAH
jgi:hypothetical protein